jgi:hypothetical protein
MLHIDKKSWLVGEGTQKPSWQEGETHPLGNGPNRVFLMRSQASYSYWSNSGIVRNSKHVSSSQHKKG